jgi:glucose/arabinose dehydrogenase
MRAVVAWARVHKLTTAIIVVMFLALIGSANRSPNVETTATPTAALGTQTVPPSLTTLTAAPSHLPFTLDFEASADATATMTVTGSSNLPNGALLNISVARPFLNEGEEDIRESTAGSVAISLVDGRFNASIPTDESDLLIGVDSQFPIALVGDSLTVCVTFQTGADQDGQARQTDPLVVQAVGPNGESLADSPHLQVFGSATANPANWLEVFKMVPSRSLLISRIATQQGSRPAEGSLEGFCLS